MILKKLDRHRDIGLFILRVGIGIMFMLHGFPKLAAGPALWTKLGGALGAIGVHFAPAVMGFLAALSEFGGGLLLVLGLFTRPACVFMFVTMAVATVNHVRGGDPFLVYSHALEAAILFFSLFIIGPGRISLDEKLSRKK